MLQVQLDIFSGRPNPAWILTPKEERELSERLRADPSLMLPMTAEVGGLGYRGYIVERIKDVEESERKKAVALPSRFRIGGRYDKEAVTSLWLLDTSEKPDIEVDDYLREVAADAIRQPIAVPPHEQREKREVEEKGVGMSCLSTYYSSSWDFSYWNGSAYMPYNNCYNFAANYRSNTYAQPGRISGHQYSGAPDCAKVANSIQYDGWFNSCQSADNLCICLAIWPGYDYHFYRKCSDGIWCHKPAASAARNTDFSGNIIYNPESSNRSGYTVFCGYWYANNYLMVVK